jgi:hypothetical protein
MGYSGFNLNKRKEKMNLKHKGYSWHHEITHFPSLIIDGEISHSDKHNDFCSYSRWFMWKLLVVIPATILIVGSYLGFYFAGWVNLFSGGGVELFISSNVAWFVTHAVVILFGLLALFFYCGEKYEEVKTKNHKKYESDLTLGLVEKKELSIFFVWYKKIKDKYCPTMDY